MQNHFKDLKIIYLQMQPASRRATVFDLAETPKNESAGSVKLEN